MFFSAILPICISIYFLFIYLSSYLAIQVHIHVSIYPSTFLPTYLSAWLPVCGSCVFLDLVRSFSSKSLDNQNMKCFGTIDSAQHFLSEMFITNIFGDVCLAVRVWHPWIQNRKMLQRSTESQIFSSKLFKTMCSPASIRLHKILRFWPLSLDSWESWGSYFPFHSVLCLTASAGTSPNWCQFAAVDLPGKSEVNLYGCTVEQFLSEVFWITALIDTYIDM